MTDDGVENFFELAIDVSSVLLPYKGFTSLPNCIPCIAYLLLSASANLLLLTSTDALTSFIEPYRTPVNDLSVAGPSASGPFGWYMPG